MSRLLGSTTAVVTCVIFAGLVVALPLAHTFGQSFYIAFLARAIIYCIAASALNIALGYGGLVSFGHALFLGVGGYAAGLASHYGIGNGWLHLVICVVTCSSIAYVTGLVSLRTAGIAFIMITLAFSQMAYYLFVSLKIYGGDDGLPIGSTSTFGPIDLGSTNQVYIVSLIVLFLTTLFSYKIRSAPFGMTLRGAQQNARRISAIGLPVLRYQISAYVISGTICGVAGLLLANLNAFASPSTLAWSVSGELIVMVVLGGMGTVCGPILGALAYIGLEEVLKLATDHWMAVFGLIIFAVALMGKRGIAGFLDSLDSKSRRGARRRAVAASGSKMAAAPGARS